MYAHFTAPENLPFAVALGLFFLIGILQMFTLLTGISLFGWLDSLLPDIDAAGEVAPSLGADTGGSGADALDVLSETSWVSKTFAWMNFGRVPFIISFLFFLFLYACIGYNGQLLIAQAGLGMLPAIVAGPLVLLVCVYPLKWGNALLSYVTPRDETSAVSADSHIGRIATITIGEATHTRTAEARLRGAGGHTHYVMVRADREGMSFKEGAHVLIVSREATGSYTCIAVSNPNLDTD